MLKGLLIGQGWAVQEAVNSCQLAWRYPHAEAVWGFWATRL